MTGRARVSRAVIAPVLAAGLAACSAEAGGPVPAFATTRSECPEHAIGGAVTCYLVTVPEDPARPDGRAIDLEVMVLEARSAEPRDDPLVAIPGGPGQSATRAAGTRDYFAEVFDPLRDERDIVLLAPRGTAGSGELGLDPSPEILFDDLATVVPASWTRAARARLAERADLTSYTTSHIAEDLETIRAALGYGALNIYGTSYGTRVAQLYAARYPRNVRTLVLKAPVPPTAVVPLTYTTGSQRALDALFELCREQEACRAAYPAIEERFAGLLERLREDSASLTVTNPLSGAEAEIRIDDTALGYLLRNLMMAASGGATTLAVIDQASRGDFSAVSAAVPALRAAYATALAGGMAISVIASEDVPRVTDELLEEDVRSGFLRGAVARGMLDAAEGWPRADVRPDLYEFLEADIPTLLVTGDFDPATPPAFAEEIAGHLPSARVLVFPGGAHSANNFDGLGGIMADFVRSASVDGLDLTAVERNRPLPLVSNR
ncbi:MAG: alpha/beta fold hydrolase [Gemmatimonadota bacterium]|nr:alpha/beta fold hydrolase [Gemmatimonadota bacterium]